MTFRDDLETAAGNEQIQHVVIGDMGWSDYGDDERHAPGLARKGIVIPWSEGRDLLNYDYEIGYGAPDCHSVYAWTPTRVLFVWQYDGATGVETIPRNPVDCLPEMPGGG